MDDARQRTSVSSSPHHAAAEAREHSRPATNQAGNRSEEAQERWTEGEQDPESDEVSRKHSADVTIALSVLLAEPVSVNATPQPAPDKLDTLVVTIESTAASTHITFGVMAQEMLQPQAIEPGAEQGQPAAVEPSNSQKESHQSLATLRSGPGIMTDGQAGAAQTEAMPEASPATDAAPLLSDMPVDGEANSNDVPSPSFNRTVQASDARFERPAGTGSELSHAGDHPGAEVTVEQRTVPEWSQSGGQDEAMGQRDDQQAGGQTDTMQPGRHAAPREGFSDTVAAMAGDRTASSEGADSRTSASSLTGRAPHASWPNQDESRPAVQAVSLNLEPADLGPVNVRIFMTDRTVHAHIRTDHMDLGQGMLSQQQQLETKLQSSGLEMGEFKVTVDNQQLFRGDSQGWLGRHSDRHPLTVEVVQRAADGDTREQPPAERRRHVGIVSLFA
jgi:hypothetical protein